jgi:hypothetical protein
MQYLVKHQSRPKRGLGTQVPREVAHEELMDRIWRDTARSLADQAAIRALTLKLVKGYSSSDDADDEEMPDPGSRQRRRGGGQLL